MKINKSRKIYTGISLKLLDASGFIVNVLCLGIFYAAGFPAFVDSYFDTNPIFCRVNLNEYKYYFCIQVILTHSCSIKGALSHRGFVNPNISHEAFENQYPNRQFTRHPVVFEIKNKFIQI